MAGVGLEVQPGPGDMSCEPGDGVGGDQPVFGGGEAEQRGAQGRERDGAGGQEGAREGDAVEAGRAISRANLVKCAIHGEDPNWVGIGSGTWDDDGRDSWVRLDRVLDVPEEGIRREGAILDRATFETVAVHLRTRYSWS